MGANNSSPQAVKNSQITQSSDPSVSIISYNETLISLDESNPAFSEAVGLGDAPVEGVLTVWAPVDSKKLVCLHDMKSFDCSD